MKEKTCRCGASKKRFKMDIGPFFVGECCSAAGFDELGRPKLMEGEAVTVSKAEGAELDKLAASMNIKRQEAAPSYYRRGVDEEGNQVNIKINADGTEEKPAPAQKLGRGILMDMKIDNLKALAKQKGIAGADQMTKRQLVQAIFEP